MTLTHLASDDGNREQKKKGRGNIQPRAKANIGWQQRSMRTTETTPLTEGKVDQEKKEGAACGPPASRGSGGFSVGTDGGGERKQGVGAIGGIQKRKQKKRGR